MSIVFHVGAPKCGSSALQSALTRQPRFESEVLGLAEYYYIDKGWQLCSISGKEVISAGHIQSAGFLQTHLPSPSDVASLALELNKICQQGISPVLSSEAWLNSAGFFNSGLLDQLEADVEILLWVRPQVEFMNSSWWQWGAWVPDIGFERWCEHHLFRCQWGRKIQRWQERHKHSYRVRLARGDVVEDFSTLYGVTGLEARPHNVSLDARMLRFLQANRELRTSAHDVRVVSALQRHLHTRGSGAPWIISPECATHIVDFSREHNLSLQHYLSDEHAREMQDDPHWWDAASYANRTVESPNPVPLATEELNAICAEVIDALVRVDKINSGLRRETAVKEV